MPKISATCPTCGNVFEAWSYPGRTPRTYCSQQCWLRKHNNPERNKLVAQQAAEKLGDARRDVMKGGKYPTYRKRGGRHEHRIVVEQMLGRPLRSDEIVHHINGDQRDNRPINLTVVTRAQHAQIHFHGKEIQSVDLTRAD